LAGGSLELQLAAAAAAALAVLVLLPLSYQASIRRRLLTYGLIAAIAALGFNLLLGYTWPLHCRSDIPPSSAIGAYSVAFLARTLPVPPVRWQSSTSSWGVQSSVSGCGRAMSASHLPFGTPGSSVGILTHISLHVAQVL